MAVIANLDIILGAQTGKLDTGLDRSQAKVSKFRTDLVSRLPGGGFLTQGASTLSAFGPAGLAAAAGVGAVASAATGAVVAIRSMRQAMGDIDEIAKSAATAGVTFRELAGFRLLTAESIGKGPEVADKALQKLQIRLAEAARNGGALNDQLQAVGLDAASLLQSGPIEAMKQLSVATREIQSPTDQLLLAFRLFEEEGAAFVSTLRQGPGAIAESIEAAERMGLTLSQAQAKQVEAANDAWGRVQQISTGVWRQISAEAAPVLEVIADEINAFAEGFGGTQALLPQMVDNLVVLAGLVTDLVEASMVFNNIWRNLATGNFSGAADAIRSAADFGSGGEWLDKVRQARAEAAANASAGSTGDSDVAAIQAQVEASKRAADEKQRREEQALQSANQRMAQLREEITGLRQGAEAAERMKMAREGFSPAQSNRILALEQEKKRLTELEDMRKRGQDLQKQFAAPKDQLRAEIAEFEKLFRAGQIDFATLAIASRDAAKRHGEKPAKQEPPSFGALQKGSAEAFSAALRNDKASKQATEQAKSNELLTNVNTWLERVHQTLGTLTTIGNAG